MPDTNTSILFNHVRIVAVALAGQDSSYLLSPTREFAVGMCFVLSVKLLTFQEREVRVKQ
jgi:hypothetical protein